MIISKVYAIGTDLGLDMLMENQDFRQNATHLRKENFAVED